MGKNTIAYKKNLSKIIVEIDKNTMPFKRGKGRIYGP